VALVLSSSILRSDSEESFVLPEFPVEIVRLGIEADDPARVPPRIALHLRLAVDVDPWSRWELLEGCQKMSFHSLMVILLRLHLCIRQANWAILLLRHQMFLLAGQP